MQTSTGSKNFDISFSVVFDHYHHYYYYTTIDHYFGRELGTRPFLRFISVFPNFLRF